MRVRVMTPSTSDQLKLTDRFRLTFKLLETFGTMYKTGKYLTNLVCFLDTLCVEHTHVVTLKVKIRWK